MPAIKAFELTADDIVELSTEIEPLRNEEGSFDGKCLEEGKAKLLNHFNDKNRAIFKMARIKKQL